MSFIQAKQTATYDLYGLIHKALRLSLTELLIKMGRADATEDQTISALARDLRQQLHLSAKHLHHEDAVIHPALEQRCAGGAARLEQAHDHHREAFAEMQALIGRLEAAGADRAALWRALYLRYSQFVAEDFAHMAEEELITQPLLQTLFTDAELLDLEHRIHASIAPDDMMAFLGRMVEAGTHSERVALLKAVKMSAPAEAYDAVVRFAVQPLMSAEDWQVLDWAIDQA